MFAGEAGQPERAARHVARRCAQATPRSILVDGEDIRSGIAATRAQMRASAMRFVAAAGAAMPATRSATWSTPVSGRPRPAHGNDGLRLHPPRCGYVSNLDAADLAPILKPSIRARRCSSSPSRPSTVERRRPTPAAPATGCSPLPAMPPTQRWRSSSLPCDCAQRRGSCTFRRHRRQHLHLQRLGRRPLLTLVRGRAAAGTGDRHGRLEEMLAAPNRWTGNSATPTGTQPALLMA